MNTKHTPGPWRAVQPESQLERNNAWNIIASSPHVESLLQTVASINGPWKQANYAANARLIAACPELLVALQRAVEQFDYTVKSMTLGHTVSISSLQNCSAMARQAILKATGGKE